MTDNEHTGESCQTFFLTMQMHYMEHAVSAHLRVCLSTQKLLSVSEVSPTVVMILQCLQYHAAGHCGTSQESACKAGLELVGNHICHCFPETG